MFLGVRLRQHRTEAWSTYPRRALLTLPPVDAELLDATLGPLLVDMQQALPSYPSAAAAARS